MTEVATEEVVAPSNTYIIRPNFQHKFRPAIVKECIHQVLMDRLGDKSYDAEEIMDWSKSISDEIKNKLKDLGYDRYKFIVQVAIGEQRGEGVKMGCRCFWDSDTDNFAQDIFMNNSVWRTALKGEWVHSSGPDKKGTHYFV